MKSNQTGFPHLFAALRYSLSGLRFACGETAVRHELYLGIAHFVALFLLDLDWRCGLGLTALWFALLVTELLNTAIEAVVDLVSPAFHPQAKRAKDLGSAACFLAQLVFVLAWLVVLLVTVFLD